MNNILITGGAGFIGSTLANFYSKNHQVIVVDDLSMGNKNNLDHSDNIRFIEGSVTDFSLMEELLKTNQFDYIFHLAAVASVADSVERPVETHQVNFDSVFQLLELIRAHQADLKRLVFTSSAAVYGDEPTLPKAEESVIRPLTPYAIDKFAAEKYVVDYYHLYQIPTSAVRFFNVYGPKQNPESPYSGVISIIMDRYKKLLNKEETSFTMFGDGSQSRDFVFIEDVVQALDLVATSNASLGEVYNVGTGTAINLNDLVATLDELLASELPVQNQPERSGDIKYSLADISKIKAIGYEPKHTIKAGLEKYVSYELAQEKSDL
ncbi:NAD-dependent epimerase/dehydratase family protein [Enterococcus sp. DIV0242_7C1]|uniref:NAD-dependent epimerase/dehydratase n=1 Tax=Candidatus Enterococcus dunnyi TaxID=1834192 RepID=A0A200J7V3_9ENTE|nr:MULTISPECIES: NAD-dependent epimerase/dehydratase family protein [unclassified Enterococcus]MBO0470865.1 NAD-dependent epimerase/dehydratase family protein [Enterococcus sp. DIV0242_7C1]OUZ33312.1 NAD-dependent epimerase/dehydratase [Enterococcus sp. 9D6_DIV0238]